VLVSCYSYGAAAVPKCHGDVSLAGTERGGGECDVSSGECGAMRLAGEQDVRVLMPLCRSCRAPARRRFSGGRPTDKTPAGLLNTVPFTSTFIR